MFWKNMGRGKPTARAIDMRDLSSKKGPGIIFEVAISLKTE